jgi:hypothetical protein
MSFALLLGLVEIQLARTLRLTLSRMLIARQIRAPRHVHRHPITRSSRRTVAQRMTRLRLELFGYVVLDTTAVPAMRIVTLSLLFLKTLALLLSKVGHDSLHR